MGSVIVKEQFDYADEFDVYGFSIHTEEELDKLLIEIKQKWTDNQEIEVGFGTNEDVEFHSFDDFMNGIEIIPCSDEEASWLNEKVCRGRKFFGYTFILTVLEYLD